MERTEDQRRALRSAHHRPQSAVADGLFGAEAPYRSAVTRMREVLQGSDIPLARAALLEMIGPVPVRPAAGGLHLEALIRANTVPLMRAVGAEREWIGSGGNNRIHSRWVSLARNQ